MNPVQRKRLNHAAKELVICRKRLKAAEAEWEEVNENLLNEDAASLLYVGDPFPPDWTPRLLFPEHQKRTDQPAAVNTADVFDVDTRDTYQVHVDGATGEVLSKEAIKAGAILAAKKARFKAGGI